MDEGRWELASTHRGAALDDFIEHYFSRSGTSVILFAGAGFDPRSPLVAERIGRLSASHMRGFFFQERRPQSSAHLRDLADANLERLKVATQSYEIIEIDIFSSGNTVVGGRRAAAATDAIDLSGASDVVVDISAMSVGIIFPVIKLLQEKSLEGAAYNLHIFVAHDPVLDSDIKATASDTVESVHGFAGGLKLAGQSPSAAKLWLPQVATRRAGVLKRIYEELRPDEVCPIIPFPSRDPRLGDVLLEELVNTDGAGWETDARDIVYADEADPLDLYRTILRLHSLRKPVFDELFGSKLILSPVGTKVMALGALLAALERDLPVVYMEDLEYEFSPENVCPNNTELLHIWAERRMDVDSCAGQISSPALDAGQDALMETL
jgi:hypothetical protein